MASLRMSAPAGACRRGGCDRASSSLAFQSGSQSGARSDPRPHQPPNPIPGRSIGGAERPAQRRVRGLERRGAAMPRDRTMDGERLAREHPARLSLAVWLSRWGDDRTTRRRLGVQRGRHPCPPPPAAPEVSRVGGATKKGRDGRAVITLWDLGKKINPKKARRFWRFERCIYRGRKRRIRRKRRILRFSPFCPVSAIDRVAGGFSMRELLRGTNTMTFTGSGDK
jgi:hypothetical protein